MMRSLFAAVSGLRNHQTRMDVIGNNIANVNTTGYKSSRVTFSELFTQTLRGASSPQGDRGGTNPQQIGLGVGISSIDVLQSAGSLQPTGSETDMAIQGSGFFTVSDGEQVRYTRNGAFGFDSDGYLVDAAGNKVLGWVATGGVLPDPRPSDLSDLAPVQSVKGGSIAPSATATVDWGKNLDSRVAVGTAISRNVDVFDSQGVAHTLNFTFTKTAGNQWDWDVTLPAGTTVSPNAADETLTGTIQFDLDGSFLGQADGDVASATPDPAPQISFDPGNGSNVVDIDVDFSGFTQYASETTATWLDQDGYEAGVLTSRSFDTNGVLTGTYSNGLTQPLAQVAIADFANPAGLVRLSSTTFAVSNNSGDPKIDQPGVGGRGTIAPQNLEMSNVDLAQEFTSMIIAQRGFQANSRVITTSDEMLQELASLKR